MARARLSSKYQVVIPHEIRKRHRIQKGEVLDVFSVGSHIAVVPEVDAAKLKGAFPEITLEGFREEENRY
ncbi:MAG: AbrB/MazE/SpoVT family DNA-binding domain-containing protein [Armatimonadota bacterium]